MCRRITCRTCNKPSFAGCGLHIEDVLGDVAPEDRCSCDSMAKRGGWLSRLFNRSS